MNANLSDQAVAVNLGQAQLNLSAAAAHIVALAAESIHIVPVHHPAFQLWCDLTGLGGQEALDYAQAAMTAPSAVTAYVAPF